VAVIGRRVRRADAATALASVAGYTVARRVGAGLAARHPTMWPGKSFDTHGRLGLGSSRPTRWIRRLSASARGWTASCDRTVRRRRWSPESAT